MKRIGLFPGTFDPITIGHQDIINRSLPLFDKLVIGIGRNVNKEPMFSEEQRLGWIREIYKGNPKVDAVVYEGLTIGCCQRVGAQFILRGIRYVNDFEYEKAIADMNRSLDNNIETVFLTCLPQYTSVASTLVMAVILAILPAEPDPLLGRLVTCLLPLLARLIVVARIFVGLMQRFLDARRISEGFRARRDATAGPVRLRHPRARQHVSDHLALGQRHAEPY